MPASNPLLFEAIFALDRDELKRLLDGGVNPESVSTAAAGWRCGSAEQGDRPLHLAAYVGFFDLVQILLDAGADREAPGEYGDRPLHAAARAARPSVIAALLDAGADVNAENAVGETALNELLVYASAPPSEAQTNRQPLKDSLHTLLTRGADPCIKNTRGYTALEQAQASVDPDIIEHLQSFTQAQSMEAGLDSTTARGAAPTL